MTDLEANAGVEEFDQSGGCIQSESGCIEAVMIDGCMMVMSRINIGSFVLVLDMRVLRVLPVHG